MQLYLWVTTYMKYMALEVPPKCAARGLTRLSDELREFSLVYALAIMSNIKIQKTGAEEPPISMYCPASHLERS